MDTKLKQRLVGAAVIAALIFIALAVLLKNNSPTPQQHLPIAKSPAVVAIQPTNNVTPNPQSVNNNSVNLADNNSSNPSTGVQQTSNTIPSPDNINTAKAANNQPTQVTVPGNSVANQNLENTALNNQPVANPSANAAKAIADNNVIVNSENSVSAANTTPPIPTPNTANNSTNQNIHNSAQNQITLNQTTSDQTVTTQIPPTDSTVDQPQAIQSSPATHQKSHKIKISQTKIATIVKTTKVTTSTTGNKKIKADVMHNTNSHNAKGWAVQVGSFKEASNADALSKKLSAHHFTTYTMTFNTNKGIRTHVYVGSKSLDKASAEVLIAQLQKSIKINAILVPASLKATHSKKIIVIRKKSSVVEDSNTNV